MFNTVVGFVDIKKDATSGVSAVSLDLFKGKQCRVLEFSKHDGSVLIIDSDATGLATFDKSDIYRSFECLTVGDVVCPPGLNEVDQILYSAKCYSRKGGYNNLLRNMVIQMSLMQGKFSDGFLWAKQ